MIHQKILKILTYTLMIVFFKSGYVYSGLSETEFDDMIEASSDAINKCLKEFDISSSEEEKMYTDPDYNYDPFLLSCIFTTSGVMEKGMLNIEKFMTLSKLYVQREDELERLYKLRQECLKVNEAKVSDGEDGYAERAKLLYDCLKENGDDFVLVEEQYRKS